MADNRTTTIPTIDRRALLAGGAAAGTVAAIGAGKALAAETAPGGSPSMAELCRLYWRQLRAVNDTWHATDDEYEAHAAATYDATMERMLLTPVRTAEDASAALQWLCDEGADLGGEYEFTRYEKGDCFHGRSRFSRVVTHLVEGLRSYLAGQGRLA